MKTKELSNECGYYLKLIQINDEIKDRVFDSEIKLSNIDLMDWLYVCEKYKLIDLAKYLAGLDLAREIDLDFLGQSVRSGGMKLIQGILEDRGVIAPQPKSTAKLISVQEYLHKYTVKTNLFLNAEFEEVFPDITDLEQSVETMSEYTRATMHKSRSYEDFNDAFYMRELVLKSILLGSTNNVCPHTLNELEILYDETNNPVLRNIVYYLGYHQYD